MENAKLQKLIKCLNMASSSHDGEAINAVRLATQILKQEGWTWEKLFLEKITLIADPFGAVAQRPPEPKSYAPPPPPYYQPKPRRPPVRRRKPPPTNISIDELFKDMP